MFSKEKAKKNTDGQTMKSKKNYLSDFKVGIQYKLHEINKYDFLRNNYLSPMAYRVRIRVAK